MVTGICISLLFTFNVNVCPTIAVQVIGKKKLFKSSGKKKLAVQALQLDVVTYTTGEIGLV